MTQHKHPGRPASAGPSDARTRLVRQAVKTWTNTLVDPSARNPLLFYRDLTAGTLDLGRARPGALASLLQGRTQRISQLFDEDQQPDALKRARTVHRRAQELLEERGILTAYLVPALVTWDDAEAARPPAAPALLWPVRIEQSGLGQGDLTLTVADEAQPNLPLLHLLKRRFGVEVDPDRLVDLAESAADSARAVDHLRSAARAVPGLRVMGRTVVGNFTYAKLPMVHDLENATALLAGNDVVAALAGDQEAARAVRRDMGDVQLDLPDTTAPSDEFLVLDADSSQSHAVNAVLAGHNLVIEGPPGTGKSQTIANLIAALTARGRKVLFVAEKRAAIDAVLGRLDKVGLDDLVMDLHGGAGDRRRILQDLSTALTRAGRTPLPDNTELHRTLTQRRTRLTHHDALMHRPRSPWGTTLADAQNRCLGTRSYAATDQRLSGPVLSRLHGETHLGARDDLARFAALGGTTLSADSSPWYPARRTVTDRDAARRASTALAELRGTLLPAARRAAEDLAVGTSLRVPGTAQELRAAAGLLERVQQSLAVLRHEAFAGELDALTAATATGSWRKEHGVQMAWGRRRALRKQARALTLQAPPRRRELHTALSDASAQLEQWKALGAEGAAPDRDSYAELLAATTAALTALDQGLTALAALLPGRSLDTLPFDGLGRLLDALAADEATLHRLPELHGLSTRLAALGLQPLLDELVRRRVDEDTAAAVYDHCWHASLLQQAGFDDAAYGAFDPVEMDGTVGRFRQADTEHIRAGAPRVRRAVAERIHQALQQHPEQSDLVRAQANRKRGLLSLRDLLDRAPEVLTRLKPCWAMSPLVVSEVLPARQLFDVVIFDEASQVVPAEAIPAIMRAGQVVVAGDRRQLPPTSFFSGASEEEPEVSDDSLDGRPAVSYTTGYESVLDVLGAMLQVRSLTWHYRSRDERLIAFSNAWIYDSSLTTFPGVSPDGALSHVLVDQGPAVPGQERSGSAEVDRVVRLVIEHAEQRPTESLGVITMGIEHANRIEAAIRAATDGRDDLHDFFREDREERFFVKNLERVQGDERDAIILSVGYGKSTDGRMLYRFGPLNNTGGERRLNVAVTRARHRMTVVSSFGAHDMDPDRLKAQGAKLLRSYIEFAASGGNDLGTVAREKPALNPFEIDVRDRLTAEGIPLVAQWGVAGYWLDFAARHPRDRGRMVLAIEADGATYHSSATARDRDRLRQEQLERLGWTFHRIWSTAWFRDPEREVRRARDAYDRAVATADGASPSPGPAESVSLPAQRSGAGVPTGPTRRMGTDVPVGAPAEAGPARGRRPALVRGQPITAYSERQLVGLIRWIESDTLLRTEEELVREAMQELGFSRMGPRIRAALENAVRTARRPAR